MIVDKLALIAAACFTSASAYINGVEQPARFPLPPDALLTEWKISYKRGTIMQVSLAVAAAALGSTAFIMAHDWRWICGALLLLALLPYTFLAVMPTNRLLMTMPVPSNSAAVHSLVRRWGYLHAGRTAFGAAATVAFFLAML